MTLQCRTPQSFYCVHSACACTCTCMFVVRVEYMQGNIEVYMYMYDFDKVSGSELSLPVKRKLNTIQKKNRPPYSERPL